MHHTKTHQYELYKSIRTTQLKNNNVFIYIVKIALVRHHLTQYSDNSTLASSFTLHNFIANIYSTSEEYSIKRLLYFDRCIFEFFILNYVLLSRKIASNITAV